ncbi:MAG: hypothetical protein GY904_15850, partial [Planctomycetaceae bacterium]|nr:hypothetical protein [Planctomycetaceae bacterium]
IISDPRRALDRFRYLDPAEKLPANLMVFSTAGLGFEAIDAFNEFVTFPMGQNVPCLILVKKERRAEILERLDLKPHHSVLTLPLKFAEIREQLQQLLKLAVPDDASANDD